MSQRYFWVVVGPGDDDLEVPAGCTPIPDVILPDVQLLGFVHEADRAALVALLDGPAELLRQHVREVVVPQIAAGTVVNFVNPLPAQDGQNRTGQ